MAGLSSSEIETIERELGAALPNAIKAAYAMNNGLRGPTNIWLVFPRSADRQEDIVAINQSLKGEAWFPDSLREQVIVGEDGCGGLICLSTKDRTAGLWYPADGAQFQEQTQTIEQLWVLIRRQYAEGLSQ